jgi:hypothetical protein
MTKLTITPKTADKTARFRGTVAAGEHVAVTIKGGAEWIGADDGANLMLRVIDLTTKRTLAVFPRPPETLAEGETFTEGENEWDSDEADLTCTLNLNTARMVNAARHMITVPVLFVLGDTDNPRTLYFRDQYEVEYWPERIGDDTPYDLGKWPAQIDEWTAQIGRMKAEAKAVPEGVEIKVWDGRGAEPDAVKVLNGKDGKDGEVLFEDMNAALALKADKEDTFTKDQTQDAINSAVSGLVANAPAAYDTLKEIADWIAKDETGTAAIVAQVAGLTEAVAKKADTKNVADLLSGKVDKEDGKGLSSNDFTDDRLRKLDGVEDGAQKNPDLSLYAKKADIPASSTPSSASPLMDGTANAGSSDAYARGDHRHPTDTSRAAAAALTNLAQTVAQKANSADLRYALATPVAVVAHRTLPANCFPVTFAYEGTSYSVDALVEASAASAVGDMFLSDWGDAYSLGMVVSPASGGEKPDAIEVATFRADGVFESGVDGLQFGGVSPVVSSSPTLAAALLISLTDRASNAVVVDGGATTATLTLPAAVPSYMRDLIVDVNNSAGASDFGLEFASDGVAYLDAGGVRYLVGVPDGDDLADLTTVAAGKRARLYITESAQRATPVGATESVPVIGLQRLTIAVVGGES